MKTFIITVFIILYSITGHTQNYSRYAQSIFLNRLPSAKSEAMGKITSVYTDYHFVSISNPALLTYNKGINVFFSNSHPYYLLTDFLKYQGGVNYIHKNIGAFSFNFMHVYNGEIITTNEFGTVIDTNKWTNQLYTLSYANNIRDYFSVGVNLNLYVDNFYTDKTFYSYPVDLGFSKTIQLIQSDQLKDDLQFGISIKNILNSSVEGNSTYVVQGISTKERLPSVLRIGSAYSILYDNDPNGSLSPAISGVIAAEYQNMLNSKYFSAYRIGAEIGLFNILFFRSGYYSETEDNSKSTNGKSSINSLTYGLGLKLSFARLFDTAQDIILTFDFASLPQPTYVTDRDDWDSFTVFNAALIWDLIY